MFTKVIAWGQGEGRVRFQNNKCLTYKPGDKLSGLLFILHDCLGARVGKG
jgi:hypothetical protein